MTQKKRRSSSHPSRKDAAHHRQRVVHDFWKKYGMMVLAVIAALIIGTVLLKFISR